MLLEEAQKHIFGDFPIGEKETTPNITEKCRRRMDNLINMLKGKEIKNMDLPYVESEVKQFLNNNPDPEMYIQSSVIIELLEKIVYPFKSEVTVEDKIIIAYLAIYCSI